MPKQLFVRNLLGLQLDLNHLKTGYGSGFLKVFGVVFGFPWGPLGSWVGEPPLRVEHWVG